MHLLEALIEGLAGVAVVLFAITDVFQSVLMPRATGIRFRLSARVAISGWLLWRNLSWRITDSERREAMLALFAPLLLATFLVLWTTTLIIGFGLCFFALRAQIAPRPDILEAWYLAGTTFLTLGFGDFVGKLAPARFLTLIVAGTGVATVAVVTAFLFAVFGSFQRRETFVVSMGHAAGAPASGLHLLTIYADLDVRDDLPLLFREAQAWAAEVMESHLAYPVLMYFRSSHDDESWLATLGALLDAANLSATTIDGGGQGQARLFLELGMHVMRDFTAYFHFDEAQLIGVEESEFTEAYEQLRTSGFALVERAQAWQAFSQQRLRYANNLNAIARYFLIPPAQWIGDRSHLRTIDGLRDHAHP